MLCAVPGLAADAGSIALGRDAFTHRCSMCHREGGTGTFTLARRLGADKALLEKRSDLAPDYIRYVVRWGVVNMPRMSRVELPEADLDAVIAYLTAPRPAP
jgi:mono/diheme cytochrome c family protein